VSRNRAAGNSGRRNNATISASLLGRSRRMPGTSHPRPVAVLPRANCTRDRP
jgi:hypothetical protein